MIDIYTIPVLNDAGKEITRLDIIDFNEVTEYDVKFFSKNIHWQHELNSIPVAQAECTGEILFAQKDLLRFYTALHTHLYENILNCNLEKYALMSYICARFPTEETHNLNTV